VKATKTKLLAKRCLLLRGHSRRSAIVKMDW
jgi:hypothetical protein